MKDLDDAESIRQRIVELQLEHQGLDAIIDSVGPQGSLDELQLRQIGRAHV